MGRRIVLIAWACASVLATNALAQLSITTTSLPNGTVGVAYPTTTLAATGGTTPYTWNGAAPGGLSVSSAGVISGTPTASGQASVSVTVIDSTQAHTTKTFNITINAPSVTVTTSSLPTGTVGSTYAAALAATGGSGAYTFTASGLPPTLNVTGSQITGTPAAPFSGNVVVTATDTSTPPVSSAPRTLSLTINPAAPTITTSSLPTGMVGAAYSAALNSSGGVGPYTFSASGLPSTLSVSGNLISGTPTAPFSGTVTVMVTDSATPAGTATKTLNLTINPATLTITTSSLPTGMVGAPYSAALNVSGGVGPYTFSATGLPSTLNVAGNLISGTPTAPFSGTVTVMVTDSATPAGTATKTLNLTINPATLTITTSSLPTGMVGAAYSAALNVSGGVGPYTFSASGLPSTLSVSGNLISGTPTAPFSGTVTVMVTDSATPAGTATTTLNLTINPATLTITTSSLPAGTVGVQYSAPLAATGGTAPYIFSASGLPSTLNVAGNLIRGTPTAPFSGTVTVMVTDSATPAGTATTTLNLTINPATLTITTSSLPAGTVGVQYSAPLAATGGTGPYTFSASGLPSTLSVSGNQITGTPTAPFSGTVTIMVTDSAIPAGTATKTLSLTINPATLTITTSSLPNGTVGAAYSATLAATGGTGPYSFSASGLPSPLSVSGNQITGTPTAPFSGIVTVMVADSATPAATATKTLNLTINPATLTITTSSLPTGMVGAAYSAALNVSGGVGPYTFTASGLPSTLTVSGNQITGTPTAPFSGTVTVMVSDSATPAATATKTLSLTINPATLTITTSSLSTGTVGVAYSATLAATGGTGPYTFSASGLPSPLSVTGSQITGTPTAPFSGTVTFMVTDSATPAATATRMLSLTINPAGLAITTSSLPSGTVGVLYSATLSATGGIGPYTFSAPGLPSTLNVAGSQIAGTPAAPFSGTVTVMVTDSATPTPATATKTLSLTIDNSPVAITTATLPNGTAGATYSAALSASGGTGSYTWAITSGTLPNGLTLSGNLIGGTPAAQGSASFTVKATDTANGSATKSLSLTIDPAPVSVTTTSLPNATVGVAYSASLAATGGTGAYNWSISGSLPAGLALSGNQIAGTPNTSGTANFTVKATDAANVSASATQALSITVNNAPVRITTTTLVDGTVGVSYSQTLSASGGTATYTWSITSGSLPAGLTLSGNQIAGTPTTSGSASFSVKATDSANASAAQALSININPPPVKITTTALTDGTIGVAYSQSLSATGGTGTFTWTISAGNLPAGLMLNGNTISGTPATSGPASFTVKATDTSNASATQALSITINNAPVTITTTTLSNGTVGAAYSQSLAAMGGTGSYTWTIAGGTLPAGLALSGSSIGGTPTAAETANFSVKATDTANASATQALHISVFAGLTIVACPAATGTVGQAYTAALSAAGGVPPYQWAAAPLPAGLSLDAASGQISGTPSQSGVANFTIKLSDAGATSTTQNCSLTIAAALTVTGSGLADGTQGAAYSQALTASGGQPPYTWSVAGGSPPPGVSLDASGQLSGVPSAAGSFSFTARAADKTGASATADFSIKVVAGLVPGSCPASTGTVNQPYASTLGASGGHPPYNWSISGQLPAGLSLDSRSGAISGTPTQPGPVSFSVAVADTGSSPVTKACSITILQALSIDSGAMPATTLSAPYSQQLSASGGTPPYNWSVSSGSLPPGLSLTGSGQITGTPSSTGNFTFTLRAADSSGSSITRSFTIQVAAAVSIGSCPAASVVAGRSYSGIFTASGGLPPYTWSISSGVLPTGIQLNAVTGSINGSAADVGNFNYTVQALDKAGASGVISCALTVTPGLAITTGSVADATERSAYAQVLVANGGQPPYVWTIPSGSLPPGLALNSSTGVISGTPSQAGTFQFVAAVADAASMSAAKSYTIKVVAGLVISACPAVIAETGFSYAASLTAAGGSQPYSFMISGALPPGLSLDATANAITGTPTQTGSFPFSLAVVDKTSAAANRDCTLDVRPAVRIVTDSLPPGSTAASYVGTLSAAAGAPPYNWSTSAGALPPGLFLNAGTGQITGTPTFTGSYGFTAQIADSLGAQVSKDFTIVITQGLAITDCPTPAAILGQPYSAMLAVTGGTAPYAWSVSLGALPSGLTLQSNPGMINGTPDQAGLYPYTLRVDDASSKSTTRACSIQISSGNLTITTAATLRPALVGVAYSQSLGASGGDAPYSWSLTDGALPDGITLDAGGTISGTASSAGSYQFTVQLTDQDGTTVQQAFTLVVQAGTPPTVQITGLPDIVAPAQQPVFDVQLGSAYPSPITGSITLAFTPDPDVKVDDPAIQFATSGRTINFSVPANSSKVTFAAPIAALQTGTVAGAIQLTVKLQSNGADITPNPAPQRSIRVDRLAPKITSMTAVKTASGFEVRLIGYSTTRDVTQGQFHVVFSNGAGSDVTVTMSDAARTWFQDPGSALYGGQFSLTQPFQGASATLTSVSVTLTNGQGASAAVSANF